MNTHREIAIILWVFLTHRKNDTGTGKWQLLCWFLVYTHRKNKFHEWIWLWRPFGIGACLLVLARYRIEKRVKK